MNEPSGSKSTLQNNVPVKFLNASSVNLLRLRTLPSNFRLQLPLCKQEVTSINMIETTQEHIDLTKDNHNTNNKFNDGATMDSSLLTSCGMMLPVCYPEVITQSQKPDISSFFLEGTCHIVDNEGLVKFWEDLHCLQSKRSLAARLDSAENLAVKLELEKLSWTNENGMSDKFDLAAMRIWSLLSFADLHNDDPITWPLSTFFSEQPRRLQVWYEICNRKIGTVKDLMLEIAHGYSVGIRLASNHLFFYLFGHSRSDDSERFYDLKREEKEQSIVSDNKDAIEFPAFIICDDKSSVFAPSLLTASKITTVSNVDRKLFDTVNVDIDSNENCDTTIRISKVTSLASGTNNDEDRSLLNSTDSTSENLSGESACRLIEHHILKVKNSHGLYGTYIEAHLKKLLHNLKCATVVSCKYLEVAVRKIYVDFHSLSTVQRKLWKREALFKTESDNQNNSDANCTSSFKSNSLKRCATPLEDTSDDVACPSKQRSTNNWMLNPHKAWNNVLTLAAYLVKNDSRSIDITATMKEDEIRPIEECAFRIWSLALYSKMQSKNCAAFPSDRFHEYRPQLTIRWLSLPCSERNEFSRKAFHFLGRISELPIAYRIFVYGSEDPKNNFLNQVDEDVFIVTAEYPSSVLGDINGNGNASSSSLNRNSASSCGGGSSLHVEQIPSSSSFSESKIIDLTSSDDCDLIDEEEVFRSVVNTTVAEISASSAVCKKSVQPTVLQHYPIQVVDLDGNLL